MRLQVGKRILALMLALLVLAAFAGCDRKQEESSGSSQEESSTPVSSQVQDTNNTGSYNYSDGITAEGYFEGLTALDYVTLPDYRNMAIPEDVSTVSDADLESELNSMMSDFATSQQVTDRAVEDGDTVNIDYVGSIDGVEFDGGNTRGNGTTVTIGVTNYIDDFLEQLIGHMPGETFDVNVTFPENYGQPDLNGKDAVFVTTINYIQDQTIPELTDDFVASNWKESNGWNNVSDAKEAVRNDLRNTAVTNYLWQEIQDQAEIKELPETLLRFHEGYMVQYYAELAAQYNTTLEDFLNQQLSVESEEELIKQNTSLIESNAKYSLIAQALSEDMNVKPTVDDLAAYLLKSMNMSDYSSLEKFYGMPYLLMLTRENIVLEKLGERE
ncbi:MAG: FKBP-type peptidyl-prolyl cis-trans isomerase [Acutalibacter sp.]|nr:FKBP-type peptidyl-prolyl cis-trans isomerase [Acutalibacter sp.]